MSAFDPERTSTAVVRLLLLIRLFHIANNGLPAVMDVYMLDPDILCSRCEPISGRAHDYEIVDAEQTSASIQRWIAFLCTGIRPSIGTNYPRRSELHQNYYSGDGDERSAVPDGV
jgi:hypothetical protein